jgi:hypothetical protein
MLATNFGFRAAELGKIEALVQKHEAEFLEAWHGYFGTQG